MAEAAADLRSIGHPSPHRDRAHAGALTFGLVAAPLAWFVQLIVGYGLASLACFAGALPFAAAHGRVTWSLIAVVQVVAAFVAAAGAIAAARGWQQTRREASGDTEDMLEVGHGRTRFLALWGFMTSLGFLLAIGFSLIGLFTVPLCGS